MNRKYRGLIGVNLLLGIVFLVLVARPQDEVVYIVTSQDKQATLHIPEDSLPEDVNILDIHVVKTASGYKIIPADVKFIGPVEFTESTKSR